MLQMNDRTAGDMRRVLFLLASSRRNGNAEWLARRAADALAPDDEQHWMRLDEYRLPPFEDRRHTPGVTGVTGYSAPTGPAGVLLDATLAASEIVVVAPLYWYSLPAAAKLYLDHWSGWMRVPSLSFRERMEGKTLWAISVSSDLDQRTANPLVETLRMTAEYMSMRWGGALLGYGNQPGEVASDARALEAASTFLADKAIAHQR